MSETSEAAALRRLVEAAIQAHRDQHKMYANTSTCSHSIGGSALTLHCAVTCGYDDRHDDENHRWEDVERAYFRMVDGDVDWADYMPGGPQSTTPARPASPQSPASGEGGGAG